MVTYLILNLVFMITSIGAVMLWARRSVSLHHLLVTTAVLCLLTAVFDSAIVSSGIVAYDESKILGIRIGTAPIEDFAYAIVAALCVPVIFEKLGGNDAT